MRTVLILLMAFCFSSCYTIQYYKVSGGGAPQNVKGELIFENDTLKIVYNFYGSQGPLKFTIFNKSHEPLEINWQKSVLVMNRKVSGSFITAPSFNGTIARENHYNANDIQAQINMENEKQYLPQGSSVSKTAMNLVNKKLPRHAFAAASTGELSNSSGSYAIKVKKLHYSEENSPYVFRIHITLLMGEKEFHIDQPFFVSEAWQSRFSPLQLPVNMQKRGDMFYFL